MTFEQLRVLQAIVTEGTFRGAAKKLFKSQPAVSKMIKNLEEEIGVILFSRDEYRPVLTPQGEIFVERAVVVLKEMRELSSMAKQFANKEEPLVQVAVNAVCSLPALLPTFNRIEKAYPQTQLNVSTEQMGGAMERLLEGNADVVITTQTDMDARIMEAVPFTTVRILFVARPGYVPKARDGLIPATSMRNLVQIIVADSSIRSPTQSLDVLAGARHSRVTDFAAKKVIIMAGMGWGGMPEHLVRKELDSGKLVRIDVEGIEVRDSRHYIIRRTDQAVGIVAEALWQQLIKLSQKLTVRN